MKKLMFVFAVTMVAAFSCWANSAYDDLVKLVKAGVDEDVVIAYINGLNGSFSLSPDNIVQLKSLGASDKIITSAIQHREPAVQSGVASNSEPAPSTPAPAYVTAPQQPPEPPAVVYETAPPAGGWVWVDDNWYWQYPTGIIVDLGWRPWWPYYYYHDHWIARGGYRGGYYGGYHGGYYGGYHGGYHGGNHGGSRGRR